MARFLIVILVFAYLGTASAVVCGCLYGKKKFERALITKDTNKANDKVFKALDRNNDGLLTITEWTEDGGKEKDFERFLELIDKNDDKKISLGEFEQLPDIVIKP